MEFNNLQELYVRIKPALITKQNEMIRNGFNYIKPEDIWNYLKEVKWKKANNLSLYEMVSDVLNADDDIIDAYLKQKMTNFERIANLEE